MFIRVPNFKSFSSNQSKAMIIQRYGLQNLVLHFINFSYCYISVTVKDLTLIFWLQAPPMDPQDILQNGQNPRL